MEADWGGDGRWEVGFEEGNSAIFVAIVDAPLSHVFPEVVNEMAEVMEEAGNDKGCGFVGLFGEGGTLEGVFELADGFTTVLGLAALAVEVEKGGDGVGHGRGGVDGWMDVGVRHLGRNLKGGPENLCPNASPLRDAVGGVPCPYGISGRCMSRHLLAVDVNSTDRVGKGMVRCKEEAVGIMAGGDFALAIADLSRLCRIFGDAFPGLFKGHQSFFCEQERRME